MIALRTYFALGKTREINLLHYARPTLTNSAARQEQAWGPQVRQPPPVALSAKTEVITQPLFDEAEPDVALALCSP